MCKLHSKTVVGSLSVAVIVAFAACSSAAVDADEYPAVQGDKEGFRWAHLAQQTAWDAAPHGYARVKARCENRTQLEEAEYEIWWRDHVLVRWEGRLLQHVAGESEPRSLTFAAIATRAELLDGAVKDGKVIRVAKRSLDHVEATDWMRATPRTLWFVSRPRGDSQASAMKKSSALEGDIIKASRSDQTLRTEQFSKTGELVVESEFDLSMGGALRNKVMNGSPTFRAEWALDDGGRLIPTRIRCTPAGVESSSDFAYAFEFSEVDLTVERPRVDFTMEGLPIVQGANIIDFTGPVPKTTVFGRGKDESAAAAVEAAASAARGAGFANPEK